MAIRVEPQAEPIPGYKLIERLGGGGFGEVWKAEAPGGLHKAIKFVYGDMQTMGEESQRADQELKAMKRVTSVRHPYILSLERFDIIDGRLLIVMELADRNLWDRFKECRTQGLPGIPREELLNYLQETAEALDLMNTQYQLQHLDIKPQNLFLVQNHIKVADFGLVKDLQDRMAATITGGVTPVYAAPETFDGWVSRFCDQYSLAIVYQELLTGQRPFSGNNVHQLVMQHVQGQPNLSLLSPEDRVIIGRALAKNPDERYPSCLDLVKALRPQRGGSGESPARGSGSAGCDQPAGAGTAPLAPPASQPATPCDPANGTGAHPAEPFSGWTPAGVAEPDAEMSTKMGGLPAFPRASVSASAPRPESYTPFPQQAPIGSAPAAVVAPVTSEGQLVPALVVGLGQMGLAALKQVADELRDRFGSLDALPHLRLLHIDTDPDAVSLEAGGAAGSSSGDSLALTRREMLIARLNRAVHYLNPRPGRPRIDKWFDTNMLYRIRRNQVTGGLRALGRLAFFGNYRTINLRIQAELAAALDPVAMATATQRTGLNPRSNQPLVFVVSSLAGGSGSGMFLDLAYVVRHQLQHLGYPHPEIVGVFLLPPASEPSAKTLPLGNTYAALTELEYFSRRSTTFTARYDEREPALTSSSPPFTRCIFLSATGEQTAHKAAALAGAVPSTNHKPDARARAVPSTNHKPEAPAKERPSLALQACEDGQAPGSERPPSMTVEDTSRLAGEYLYHELTTPLGRLTDSSRSALTAPETRPPFLCQTFGLFRYSWPRRQLLAGASRRYCRHLVENWLAKDARPLQEPIGNLVQQQWTEQELGAEFLIARFQMACTQAVGREPESAFQAILAPFAGKDRRLTEGDREAVREAAAALEQLVGQPSDSSVLGRPGVLEEAIRSQGEALNAEWQERLIAFTIELVDQPGLRLAGAEEAIRLTIRLIEETLKTHETLSQELTANAGKGYERLRFLVTHYPDIFRGRKPGQVLAELAELLHLYPKWRYQGLVLRRVIYTFTSLRGFLSDQIRELGFYRVRLGELLSNLQRPSLGALTLSLPNGSFLYPPGCGALDQAVQKLFPEPSAAEFEDFDRRMQALVEHQFHSLRYVCATPSLPIRNLETAMLVEGEAYVGGRLTETDVVAAYLTLYPGDLAARDGLRHAFTQAAPPLTVPQASGQGELTILAVPFGQEDRFHQLVDSDVPHVQIVASAQVDDLVVYRERTHFTLKDLEHFGPAGETAYEQLLKIEHFTPHSRLDIPEWSPAKD